MVETSLRGRPSFSTFLQSDASVGGDGLTYYDYQRFLRSQKVALLQERRAQTYTPGYKKVSLPPSRKVFQLKNRSPVHNASENAAISAKTCDVKPAAEQAKTGFASSAKERQPTYAHSQQSTVSKGQSEFSIRVPSIDVSVTWKFDDSKRNQTERLPRISAHHRAIKSATARDRHVTWSGSEMLHHPPRPNTVAGVRDTEIQVMANEENNKKSILVTRDNDQHPCTDSQNDDQSFATEPGHQSLQKHAWANCDQTEGYEYTEPNTVERDALAHAFTWGTSTQRAYDEVGWEERIAAPILPPMSTIEQFSDPVSQRLTFRRYNSEPANWQMCGIEWDFVQTRSGSFPKGPLAINYCTSSKRTQQIPGYLGCTPYQEDIDNSSEEFHTPLLVRSLKPRPTNITRRLNIPGYTGHVHWAKSSPTHTKPETWWSTNERSHRPLPQEDEVSPFCRNGIFSKMITTVPPHNPYNKIEL